MYFGVSARNAAVLIKGKLVNVIQDIMKLELSRLLENSWPKLNRNIRMKGRQELVTTEAVVTSSVLSRN
jgi:hypothetical protein